MDYKSASVYHVSHMQALYHTAKIHISTGRATMSVIDTNIMYFSWSI